MQFQEEHKWIVKHPEELEKHRGKWIAVNRTGIVASGISLRKVHRKAPNALFFLIPRKGEENYILWV